MASTSAIHPARWPSGYKDLRRTTKRTPLQQVLLGRGLRHRRRAGRTTRSRRRWRAPTYTSPVCGDHLRRRRRRDADRDRQHGPDRAVAGHPSGTTNTMVASMSIWNYAGHVASGFGSEALLRRLPRPLALALSGAGPQPPRGPRRAAVVSPRRVVALRLLLRRHARGRALVFAVISELFGLRHYSTLFAVGTAASPVGSYLLNVLVAGCLYDA
ncbi:hypothetical protein EJB05_01548 [Eragrostis curvula]|uniref:Uncharacterized protein n=1 Tax=Eragrostis curvula TaxID=38414 RepID=A0A5J9WQF6_9POAL|nr:hypothetical protein EJB05_01548 [Eragrostis curvula]